MAQRWTIEGWKPITKGNAYAGRRRHWDGPIDPVNNTFRSTNEERQAKLVDAEKSSKRAILHRRYVAGHATSTDNPLNAKSNNTGTDVARVFGSASPQRRPAGTETPSRRSHSSAGAYGSGRRSAVAAARARQTYDPINHRYGDAGQEAARVREEHRRDVVRRSLSPVKRQASGTDLISGRRPDGTFSHPDVSGGKRHLRDGNASRNIQRALMPVNGGDVPALVTQELGLARRRPNPNAQRNLRRGYDILTNSGLTKSQLAQQRAQRQGNGQGRRGRSNNAGGATAWPEAADGYAMRSREASGLSNTSRANYNILRPPPEPTGRRLRGHGGLDPMNRTPYDILNPASAPIVSAAGVRDGGGTGARARSSLAGLFTPV